MSRIRSISASLVAALTVTTGVALATSAAAVQNEANPAGKSGNFPARIELPDGWRPEGITAGRGTTLYVGSLANGAIWRTDARTGQGGVLSPGVAGRVSVGVDHDRRNDRLWVAGGGTGEVRVVDADTGAVLRSYPVPGAAGVGFLNDVVVTRDAVYVTDSNRSLLVVIPTPDGELPPPTAAMIRPLSGGASGNGIVEARDWLVIVQSATGTLFRVDPATGTATPIDLGGYLVTNGDGLELQGNTLYVVRNRSNLVAVIDLDSHLLHGVLEREITSPGNLDVPSTAALQAGRLWAVNARFGNPTPATAPYWITQLDVHN